MEDHISFQFAVYYLPTPAADPLAALDELLASHQTLTFQRVERVELGTERPAVMARIDAEPQKEYAPPNADYLQHFGRGLSPDEAESLQGTEAVLILDWAYSKEDVWSGMRSALEITSALARSTGGLIWDEATREVFAPDAWDERRLGEWSADVPNMTRHTVIHAYREGEFLRAVTLGMEKVGLPDVVINGFPGSFGRNMGHVSNLFCQALAEGAAAEVPGEFDLDFRTIENPDVREPQVSNLLSGATGVARLSLDVGRREEGDPVNRLIEITFDRGTGPDKHAKQVHLLSEAFGSEDSVSRIEHDEAIQAASKRAREKLPTLRNDFNQGLAPGELILVKAPFATPDDGREWMWVEVTAWNEDVVTGSLANEPFDIPTLHAGQQVEVSTADVFDYIRKLPDGTTEGNETGEVIQQRQGAR